MQLMFAVFELYETESLYEKTGKTNWIFSKIINLINRQTKQPRKSDLKYWVILKNAMIYCGAYKVIFAYFAIAISWFVLFLHGASDYCILYVNSEV